MQKNNIYFFVFCLVVSSVFYYLIIDRIQKSSFNQKISANHSRLIISQIGIDSFNLMKAYHCEAPIAYYIENGIWNDAWCRSRYSHLNFTINDKGIDG